MWHNVHSYVLLFGCGLNTPATTGNILSKIVLYPLNILVWHFYCTYIMYCVDLLASLIYRQQRISVKRPLQTKSVIFICTFFFNHFNHHPEKKKKNIAHWNLAHWVRCISYCNCCRNSQYKTSCQAMEIILWSSNFPLHKEKENSYWVHPVQKTRQDSFSCCKSSCEISVVVFRDVSGPVWYTASCTWTIHLEEICLFLRTSWSWTATGSM